MPLKKEPLSRLLFLLPRASAAFFAPKGRGVVSHWHGSAQSKGVFSFQREYPLWNPKRNARGVPLDPRHCGFAA